MDTSAIGITAPSAVYEIGGRRFEIGRRGSPRPSPTLTRRTSGRVACAWSKASRCTWRAAVDGATSSSACRTRQPPRADCPSYEPPAEFSGLGQVLGSAITEDPATGETTLKLGFPLSKMPGARSAVSRTATATASASDGTKLSLRGLLHYLWDQAELTRWHPGFAGKRTWATVRGICFRRQKTRSRAGIALRLELYIPELFCVEHRDAINARRIGAVGARHGYARQAAAPDAADRRGQGDRAGAVWLQGGSQACARSGVRARRTALPPPGPALRAELALWGAADDLRMVMIATFAVELRPAFRPSRSFR